MALPTGSHKLGPDSASLQVKTYREGMASKVGHDLVIAFTRWEATVGIAGDPASSTVELSADSRSLEVREGLRGVKPLTDKDRSEIRKNIDDKALHGQPITFRSSAVRVVDGDGRLTVEGDLTMAGSTRPFTAQLNVGADDHVRGTIRLTQSGWGIKPYRGLMGALKVRDELEIVIDARLPAPDCRTARAVARCDSGVRRRSALAMPSPTDRHLRTSAIHGRGCSQLQSSMPTSRRLPPLPWRIS